MRPHIDHLDSNTLPWASPRPGTYGRLLSQDPDSGARTALARISPADGYIDQPTAHSHDATEEILVVKGTISFDSRVWLHPGGYVYHPAGWVHGFKSRVPGEAWLISRTGGELGFTYYDAPSDDYPYPLEGRSSSRPLAIVPSPWAQPWVRVGGSESAPIRAFEYGPRSRGRRPYAAQALRRRRRGRAAGPAGRAMRGVFRAGRRADRPGWTHLRPRRLCLPTARRPAPAVHGRHRGSGLPVRGLNPTGAVGFAGPGLIRRRRLAPRPGGLRRARR